MVQGKRVETSYLDLDGDGVPDAVVTTETIALDLTGDGVVDVVAVFHGAQDRDP